MDKIHVSRHRLGRRELLLLSEDRVNKSLKLLKHRYVLMHLLLLLIILGIELFSDMMILLFYVRDMGDVYRVLMLLQLL
jgi:hypothetical protein